MSSKNELLKIPESIEQMAKSRNLPVESESINVDIKIRNGKLNSVKVSFYVGKMPLDVEWSDIISVYDKNGNPLDIIALIAYELDSMYHVSDYIYKCIVDAHLDGIAFEKDINGVCVESYYEGNNTYIIAISNKPYYDIEDLCMCKNRLLQDDFCIDKYFEVRERIKQERIEKDDIRRHTEDVLRRAC